MVLAGFLAAVLLAGLTGCATEMHTFDYAARLGVVTVANGRACLSLSTPQKAGYPVFIVLPEPETATFTAHIAPGACKAEEGMIGHPLDWKRENPVAAIGIVLNGRSPSRDLDNDGTPERFRSCASQEGLHLTVWTGEVRRWHRYRYLGYDTESNCTPEETRPD